jgi:hypothetical protein
MSEITDFEASVPTEAAELIIVVVRGNIEPYEVQPSRTSRRPNFTRVIEWLRRRQ